MTQRRTTLLALLATALLVLAALALPRTEPSSPRAAAPVLPPTASDTIPEPTARPASTAAVLAPAALQPIASAERDDAVLERLAQAREARARSDEVALNALMAGSDVAAYVAATALASGSTTPPDARYAAYRRLDDLRLVEPLDREGERAFQLAFARAAEAANDVDAARTAYAAALPADAAREGLASLGLPALDLATTLLDARQYEDALRTVEDANLEAPAIEATALRALGRYEEAIVAARAWLDNDPGNPEALRGLGWSQWFLGNLAAAEAVFADLGGSEATYALGLIANRRGDLDLAVQYLLDGETADRAWLATTLLEEAGRYSEATEVYLDLAAGGSVYADDAAWRARVLAERVARPDLFTLADAAVPSDSFFAMLLGTDPPLPTRDDLTIDRPQAVRSAEALQRAGDPELARLVLAFALRDASDEPTIVALGEALHGLGEYRLPQRAAARLIAEGSEQLRTWRLAYPRAWPEYVRAEAARAGIDANLAWAVMRRESAFYPSATSRSGAQGLMQVMPTTWTWLAEEQEEAPAEPYSIDDNIRYGIFYLGWLSRLFGGDEELLVPSYNRGQGYIGRLWEGEQVAGDKDDLYRTIDALETREYLQDVLLTRRIYDRLDALEPLLASR